MIMSGPEREITVTADDLERLAANRLADAGLAAEDARLVSTILVDANLRGIDTHGVRLLSIYIDRLNRGSIKTSPDIRVTRSHGGALSFDGDSGLGQLVAHQAMRKCITACHEHGIACAVCANSSHFGAAGYYAALAAEEGLIGFAATGGTPAVAPWGSSEPLFGANPLAVAVPCEMEFPIVLDMATTSASRARIRLRAVSGETIPEGWAIDAAGNPTTDASSALKGSLLPLGGYKGYGLALVLEILSGILSGSRFGRHTADLYSRPDDPQGIGHFLGAVSIDAFLDHDEFYSSVRELVRQIRASRPRTGGEEVLLPGELEWRTTQRRRKEGIPVPASLHRWLTDDGGAAETERSSGRS
jgi:LDH2 family malate/lactate/ureidoglycolate dehydrogenase